MTKQVIEGMPRRILALITEVLREHFDPSAEVIEVKDTPAIRTRLGNIVYFSSSNKFRLFFPEGGSVTRSSPNEVVALFTKTKLGFKLKHLPKQNQKEI